ncbi:MAG: GIY-YIG nuclease family protein [Bacteroidetes bacterium]|nr:GIY-YIG nuclease family protein [Bacteroidota bacterium]
MNQYYTYILKCSDGSYYVGVTNNIEKRYNEHQEGLDTSCYTYKRRPVELVCYEMFIDINQAITREKQLKGWSRSKKEALINSDFNELIKLSKKKF